MKQLPLTYQNANTQVCMPPHQQGLKRHNKPNRRSDYNPSEKIHNERKSERKWEQRERGKKKYWQIGSQNFAQKPTYKIIYHTTFNNSTALSQFTAQGQLSFQNRILNTHKMLPWLKFTGGPSLSVVSHKLHKSQEPCQHTHEWDQKTHSKTRERKEYRTWLEVVLPQTNLNCMPQLMPGLCDIV